MATKAQAHRSSKHKGYYENRFNHTVKNKQRRQARVRRRLLEQPKQTHPVKPNQATRIVRRNVREHQAQLAKHHRKQAVKTFIQLKLS